VRKLINPRCWYWCS